MCGIAGVLDSSRSLNGAELDQFTTAMATAMTHRGPDDSGVWSDSTAGIGLSHRRLSILDLSDGGHQPMRSHSGRFTITYNGELYNYLELRKELATSGVIFRSTCDTEVLLQSIEHWGLVEALRRFNGMYAFSMWDALERRLFLARDPFGIKPLYAGLVNRKFLFSSELHAIRAVEDRPRVNFTAMQEYNLFGFISSPKSMYESIFKVHPGTALCISFENPSLPIGFSEAASAFSFPGFICGTHTHWSHIETALNGAQRPLNLTEDEAAEELERLLITAIRRQRLADAPVGAFLSGGIDSSTVVAILQSLCTKPIQTFSVGVGDPRLNEAAFARKVATHLGTNHSEITLNNEDIESSIRKYANVCDEPFADTSLIPTTLVSEFAARSVKVVLTGDGGDEIFGGYNRYLSGASLWKITQWIPPGAKSALFELASWLMTGHMDSFSTQKLGHFFPILKHRTISKDMRKLLRIMESKSIDELYNSFLLQPRIHTHCTHFHLPPECKTLSVERQLMLLDVLYYLPGDILTKVDRATMRHSLEARVPLLDIDIVRFASALPQPLLIRNRTGKYLLRKVLLRYVPAELVARPKMGFSIPSEYEMPNNWLSSN